MKIFGIVNQDIYFQIINSIHERNSALIVKTLHALLEKGNDIQEFINGLMDYIRNILLLKLDIDVPELPKEIKSSVQGLAAKFSENELLYLISLLIKTKADMKISNNPMLVAEMAFIKLSKLAEMTSLENLKKMVAGNISETRPKSEPSSKEKEEVKSPIEKTAEIKQEIADEVEKSKPRFSKLNLETVKRYQPEINEKIRKEKPFIYNYFQDCIIESVNNNIIHFLVSKPVFYKMLVDKKEEIEKIISDFYDLKLRLDFKLKQKPKEDIIVNPEMQDIERETPKLADFIKATDSVIS